jgi:hypothetical protein
MNLNPLAWFSKAQGGLQKPGSEKPDSQKPDSQKGGSPKGSQQKPAPQKGRPTRAGGDSAGPKFLARFLPRNPLAFPFGLALFGLGAAFGLYGLASLLQRSPGSHSAWVKHGTGGEEAVAAGQVMGLENGSWLATAQPVSEFALEVDCRAPAVLAGGGDGAVPLLRVVPWPPRPTGADNASSLMVWWQPASAGQTNETWQLRVLPKEAGAGTSPEPKPEATPPKGLKIRGQPSADGTSLEVTAGELRWTVPASAVSLVIGGPGSGNAPEILTTLGSATLAEGGASGGRPRLWVLLILAAVALGCTGWLAFATGTEPGGHGVERVGLEQLVKVARRVPEWFHLNPHEASVLTRAQVERVGSVLERMVASAQQRPLDTLRTQPVKPPPVETQPGPQRQPHGEFAGPAHAETGHDLAGSVRQAHIELDGLLQRVRWEAESASGVVGEVRQLSDEMASAARLLPSPEVAGPAPRSLERSDSRAEWADWVRGTLRAADEAASYVDWTRQARIRSLSAQYIWLADRLVDLWARFERDGMTPAVIKTNFTAVERYVYGEGDIPSPDDLLDELQAQRIPRLTEALRAALSGAQGAVAAARNDLRSRLESLGVRLVEIAPGTSIDALGGRAQVAEDWAYPSSPAEQMTVAETLWRGLEIAGKVEWKAIVRGYRRWEESGRPAPAAAAPAVRPPVERAPAVPEPARREPPIVPTSNRRPVPTPPPPRESPPPPTPVSAPPPRERVEPVPVARQPETEEPPGPPPLPFESREAPAPPPAAQAPPEATPPSEPEPGPPAPVEAEQPAAPATGKEQTAGGSWLREAASRRSQGSEVQDE